MLVSEFITQMISVVGRADWSSDNTQPFRILQDAIRFLRSENPLPWDSYRVQEATLTAESYIVALTGDLLTATGLGGRPGDVSALVKKIKWVKYKDSDGKYSDNLRWLDYGDFRSLYYDLDSDTSTAVGMPSYYTFLLNPTATYVSLYVAPAPKDDITLVIAYKGNPLDIEDYSGGWTPDLDTTNSWLELYPTAVKLAFQYFYELEKRNNDGAGLYLNSLLVHLKGIDRDVAEIEDPGFKELQG